MVWIRNGKGAVDRGVPLPRPLLFERHGRVVGSVWSSENTLRGYDTYAHLGGEKLGGVEWSGAYADWVSGPDSYTGLFEMWSRVQPNLSGEVTGWARHDALAHLNEVLRTEQPGLGWVTDKSFLGRIAGAGTGSIDGTDLGAWVAAQPIAAAVDQEGTELAVYASGVMAAAPTNPTTITVFAFTWAQDQQYPTM